MISQSFEWTVTVITGTHINSGRSAVHFALRQDPHRGLIHYSLKERSRVQITVRDLEGKIVLKYPSRVQAQGDFTLKTSGKLEPRMYIYTMTAIPLPGKQNPKLQSIKVFHL